MGVVHKLKPEVLRFIIENKQNNPALSCRNLTYLILEKLQVKVSKSSINAIFKENNLSMSIGRRQKQKKKKFNMPALPVIEEVKAITLVEAPQKFTHERIDEVNSKSEVALSQNAGLVIKKEEVKEEIIPEPEKENIGAEEKRIKEAEEAAMKLREEERIRAEDAKKITEEQAAQEAELRAERERWAKLAEEELKAKQQPKEEVILQKDELITASVLPQERVCSGAILLKALDCLIGGSKEINQAVCKKMGSQPEVSLNLTEALIFRALFGKDNISALWDLIGTQYSLEKLDNYYAQIQQIESVKLDTAKIISNVFTEARGVKMHFMDESIVHLDGQLHSIWSTPYFPYDFSSTVNDLKNNLNKYFFQGQPLVLFSAPGYDILPKDFFNLLLNIGSKNNYPDTLTLFGNNLEEIDTIFLNNENKYALIFGLWPWQFTASRKVKKIGDFDLKHIEEIDKDLYLGEIEIDLLQTSSNLSITLKGCAVKTGLKEKIRLVILNSDKQAMSLDKLAGIYLNHWPNFEEAFQDFSRKIELFAYVGTAQKFFSKDSFGRDMIGPILGLKEIFANYIKMLDAYLRWHFLPAGYTEKDFSFTNECFYKIPVKLTISQSRVKAKMQVSQEYQFLKDLEYLSCRFNERRINLVNGKLFFIESAFE